MGYRDQSRVADLARLKGTEAVDKSEDSPDFGRGLPGKATEIGEVEGVFAILFDEAMLAKIVEGGAQVVMVPPPAAMRTSGLEGAETGTPKMRQSHLLRPPCR